MQHQAAVPSTGVGRGGGKRDAEMDYPPRLMDAAVSWSQACWRWGRRLWCSKRSDMRVCMCVCLSATCSSRPCFGYCLCSPEYSQKARFLQQEAAEERGTVSRVCKQISSSPHSPALRWTRAALSLDGPQRTYKIRALAFARRTDPVRLVCSSCPRESL